MDSQPACHPPPQAPTRDRGPPDTGLVSTGEPAPLPRPTGTTGHAGKVRDGRGLAEDAQSRLSQIRAGFCASEREQPGWLVLGLGRSGLKRAQSQESPGGLSP